MTEITYNKDEGTSGFSLSLLQNDVTRYFHLPAWSNVSSNGDHPCKFPWQIKWAQSNSSKLNIRVADALLDGIWPKIHHLSQFTNILCPILSSCTRGCVSVHFNHVGAWDSHISVTLEALFFMNHMILDSLYSVWVLTSTSSFFHPVFNTHFAALSSSPYLLQYVGLNQLVACVDLNTIQHSKVSRPLKKHLVQCNDHCKLQEIMPLSGKNPFKRAVCFLPNMALCIKVKHLHFGLLCPKDIDPNVLFVQMQLCKPNSCWQLATYPLIIAMETVRVYLVFTHIYSSYWLHFY